jgi:HTH-type transcriptional regulator/antitoxin HigA
MKSIKYKVIKTDKQYYKYCNILEALDFSGKRTKAVEDEIDLLTLLIEHYDEEHNTFEDLDPVQLLRSLMKDHKMKVVDLAGLLEVRKESASDILKYKKKFPKKSIRILCERFKMRPEAFNRPYQLRVPVRSKSNTSNRQKTRRKPASTL